MARRVFAGDAAGFDARRNTSRVIPPSPDALPNALRALRSLRHTDPALTEWILDGHPHLTDDEHRRRFGKPYERSRSRRAEK